MKERFKHPDLWLHCIITEKATATLDDSVFALLLSLLGTAHMPKYQCTKAKQKLTMLLQIWKHPLLLILMWMCLNRILLKSLDEIGELRQKVMTLID